MIAYVIIFASAYWGSLDLSPSVLNGITWLVITLLAWAFSQKADIAASRSTRGLHKPTPWMPVATTLVFSTFIALLHSTIGIPLLLAGAIVSPVLFLPPLTYRIFHHSSQHTNATRSNTLFSFQESSRIREKAWLHPLIREFMKRYPKACTYVYKTDQAYSCGGILLHNRERLPVSELTYIEVTLECPFSPKAGILAEGREQFSAYLARHHSEFSSVVQLPQTEFHEWVQGMKSREWMEYLEALDQQEPNHTPLGSRPVQFETRYTKWEAFPLD